MSYPIQMFLEQMEWALKNLQRCYLEPATPPYIFQKWEAIFDHHHSELRLYLDQGRGHFGYISAPKSEFLENPNGVYFSPRP